MKKIVTLLAISLALFSCTGKKNDLQRMNLKGKVKSVRQIPYEAIEKFGEVQKGLVMFEYYDYKFLLFDEQGKQIEENFYNSDGSLNRESVYEYDDKGNRVKNAVYTYDNFFGIGIAKFTYKYDEKGNQIEENHVSGEDEDLVWKRIFKYDNKGNKIEENFYNSDGSLKSKCTYKYDNKGNEIEENFYNSDGSLGGKTTCKYDAKSNPIEWNSYNYSVSLDGKSTFKYTYDNHGNWIEKIEYDKNNKPTKITEREIEYYP